MQPCGFDKRRLSVLSSRLVVVQKRSSLLVLGDDGLASSEATTEDLREGNDKGGNKEGGHDGESENPLECDDLSQELADAEGGAEDAEGEAHGVVL